MKFSIIIPCYNSEKWIEQCLVSCLQQDYQDKEVIFVDNESQDRSAEIALSIQQSFPELIISNAPNLYKYSYQEPVEEALRLANGEYFTIIGSDDYIEKTYISKVANILQKSKKIQAFQSPVRASNNNGPDVGHTYKSIKEFRELLFQRCPVTTPTIVLKKELYDKGIVRWKSSEYLGAADYDLYFNLADNNVFMYPFPQWLGYYYRWHEDQCTWGMHKENINYDQIIQDFWRTKWAHQKE